MMLDKNKEYVNDCRSNAVWEMFFFYREEALKAKQNLPCFTFQK